MDACLGEILWAHANSRIHQLQRMYYSQLDLSVEAKATRALTVLNGARVDRLVSVACRRDETPELYSELEYYYTYASFRLYYQ